MLLALSFLTTAAFADEGCTNKECRGKIDTGPTYVNIDVLESGKTIRNLDLFAWKADAFYRVWSGLSVKGGVLIGGGDARFYTVYGGVGFCVPVHERVTLFPNAGYTFGRFTSTLDYEMEQQGFVLEIRDLKEKIHSSGPYLGLDISVKITDKWRAVFIYQYAWSRVRTQFTKDEPEIRIKSKDRTEGSNFAILLERDIAEHWSLSLGAGYNLSLSKDKHGLRGKGVKAGIVYWF